MMVAAKQGKPIPLGWALNRNGQRTTDAQARGARCSWVATRGDARADRRLLACALTGAAMGFEADVLLRRRRRPRIGQAFLVIDPGLAGDAYHERIETLITAMLADEGVRLPARNATASR
jgi:(2R)-3-sulfolactate dehydrogenase (NADP+)